MADRRKGLTWVDGVLLILALLGVANLLSQGFPSGPVFASIIVVVTAAISSLFVCTGKDVYRWVLRYVTAFLFSMVLSQVSFADRMFEVPRWIELPVLLSLASLPIWISLFRTERGSEYRWLAFAMFLGLLVAMFSGSAGAGSEMISWLQDKFDLTFEQAQMSNRIFRKSVHVSFYALMFFSLARSTWQARSKWFLSIMAGLVWATGHAAFDETVQSFFADRTGSLNDYLIDASGMAIALVLSWLLWGRRGKSESRS